MLPNNIDRTDVVALYYKMQPGFTNNNAYGMVDSLPSELDWTQTYEMTISGESCLILDLSQFHVRTAQLTGHQFSVQIDQSLIFRKTKEGKLYFQLVQAWGNGNSDYGLSILVYDQTGKLHGSFLSNGDRTSPSNVEFLKKRTSLPRASGMMCSETDVYSCLYYNGLNYGCLYNYTVRQCLILPGDETGEPNSSSGYGDGGGFDYGSIDKLKTKTLVNIPPTDKIIADLAQYMGCFTISSLSSYEVTLYVKQPIPDTRVLLSDQYQNLTPNSSDPSTKLTVGHTFLGFRQSGGRSTTVIRTVGFYPSKAVSPINPEAKGLLVNNSGDKYDVAITLKVTSEQFKVIVNTFNAQANLPYHLNSNNCTSIAVDALNAAGLNIPKTQGDWPLGKGADPADLGQDLRLFQSNNIKQKNLNGGVSTTNTTPCKIR